ncbi:hypothetical protein QN277_023476 [Acacia crassicarpa]|nr:hypothetical protein QN277_023476 [Acacia crassicarpa]
MTEGRMLFLVASISVFPAFMFRHQNDGGKNAIHCRVWICHLFGLALVIFFTPVDKNTDITEATLPEPFQPRVHSLICEDLACL